MNDIKEILNREFPLIDDDFSEYLTGILSGDDDFENVDHIYDAVGDFLLEIESQKSEKNVRAVCEQIFKVMEPKSKTSQKLLQSPVNIGEMAADMATTTSEIQSIWGFNRDFANKVDLKKLERAEVKLQQKNEKRQENTKTQVPTIKLEEASASQVFNKKDTKMEIKGTNRTMDIKIENFDLAFGDKVLLQNAAIVLTFGRRYGLVGRNGLGKTTLLRTLSNKQLQIPSHMNVLHVEQEVVGNDTIALESVLECDFIRTKLLQREKEISALLSSGTSDLSLSEELSEVYTQLQNIEADKAEAKASIILRGLGFSPEMQKKATKEFSGGWRMRLALARALFSKPDLLLLDEPTNMLDIKAIIWLENYLQKWPTTLLVVSHDANFLDTVPTDIIHLHSQRLEVYRGNYKQFCSIRTEKLKAQKREYDSQMSYRAHVQEFIDRFRYNANRASCVQSKIKMLEKLPELKPLEKESESKLKFPDVEPLNPPVISLSKISFSYPDGKQIFKEVDLSAGTESRICIVGENGTGKSTMLKLMIGELEPTSGFIRTHRGLRLGYFAQHHTDNLAMNLSSLGILEKEYPGRSLEEYRCNLGNFGISGDLALQSVASLSGGQKSRLALCKICMAYPNFLILDEPTNHLDIETIDALGVAINNFKGGIILVSHDERLIQVVCQELWICKDFTVKSVDGGIQEYKKQVLRELEAQTK